MSDRWAAGWYMRKRHIVNEERDHQAICSPYTGVYPRGYDRSSRYGIGVPPANDPAVMALPACGLCQRKVKRKEN